MDSTTKWSLAFYPTDIFHSWLACHYDRSWFRSIKEMETRDISDPLGCRLGSRAIYHFLPICSTHSLEHYISSECPNWVYLGSRACRANVDPELHGLGGIPFPHDSMEGAFRWKRSVEKWFVDIYWIILEQAYSIRRRVGIELHEHQGEFETRAVIISSATSRRYTALWVWFLWWLLFPSLTSSVLRMFLWERTNHSIWSLRDNALINLILSTGKSSWDHKPSYVRRVTLMSLLSRIF